MGVRGGSGEDAIEQEAGIILTEFLYSDGGLVFVSELVSSS